MKVLGGRKQCKHCGAYLEYTGNDVMLNEYGISCIECPLCHTRQFF